MKIGIPKETKILEGRVAIVPEGCAVLIRQGNEVYIEAGAGLLSGYKDEEYIAQGVKLSEKAADLYASADLIVKVKEPVEADLQHLRQHHILFCYLHLAASEQLTRQLCDTGLTAIAFETVTDEAGRLPLLKPMSEIAGTLAVHIGTHLLHQPQGGMGLMLGGLSMTEPGDVVVLGAGAAGSAAVKQAALIGARVTVIDRDATVYQALCERFPNVSGELSSDINIAQAVNEADLLIGAVLLPGLHAPRLVSERQVRCMKPGSVIIDVSVDQGGCIETIRPTNYQNPTYLQHEVLHFGVTNMPGAVPRTASQALSSVILPYVQQLCEDNWQQSEGLLNGINIRNGRIDNPLIEQAFAQVQKK
ncbi:Alanine dehydrogenase [hydrothermal vent metagenome]|uniref:alanine dehydrogenase n=1 Tax=hydrothermal vent metagenome TaxID=652676 RepID=A0A3B0Y0Y5_9ZZZZ